MKNIKKKTIVKLSVLVLVIISVVYFLNVRNQGPGKYDDFAQCLTNSGAKFYGAYWCGHCNNQKAMFGRSFKYVDYIECGIPGNPNQQTETCKQAGIQAYPTWEFSDGSRMTGELSLQTLSEKSGCEL